jgi:cysteine sulfinate desulfinase/cysteine desulfurase-like protein
LALEIALRACDLRPGDEVVIPTFCCTSVVAPILAVGANPVLADVGEELNITLETLQMALTKKSRAIIVPHLFGNPADIESIVDLARARNIRVIDDAAQALGATINGRPAGTFGDAGILSFGSIKSASASAEGRLSHDNSLLSEALSLTWQRRNSSLYSGTFPIHCCGGAGRCRCTMRCTAGELQILHGRRNGIERSPCPTSMQQLLRVSYARCTRI